MELSVSDYRLVGADRFLMQSEGNGDTEADSTWREVTPLQCPPTLKAGLSGGFSATPRQTSSLTKSPESNLSLGPLLRPCWGV